VENVYAIGDVMGPTKIMLAHVASIHAHHTLAEIMLKTALQESGRSLHG